VQRRGPGQVGVQGGAQLLRLPGALQQSAEGLQVGTDVREKIQRALVAGGLQQVTGDALASQHRP
jgi:hypothetical protein